MGISKFTFIFYARNVPRRVLM